MTAQRVRVGVVGAGSWGLNHIRVLVSEPGCAVVAVADLDDGKRARALDLAPGARGSDADAMLTAADVDAVVIATPASSHAVLTRAALLAGKHVLVEKPMAMSLADARDVAAVALATKRIGMVGHLMVFHPAVRRIRALLRSGSLGAPYYLHATRVSLGRLRRDETALWCFGPHDLSMIDYILGEHPLSVSACGQAILQPGIEDVVFMTLRYPSGQIANLHLSWLDPRKERRLTLVCSQKMVEFDDRAPSTLRIHDKGYDRPPEFTEFSEFLTLRDGDVHIPQLSMEEPLRVQLRHFLDCIATGHPPETGLTSGVRITAVLEAAQRSLELGGTPLPIATVL